MKKAGNSMQKWEGGNLTLSEIVSESQSRYAKLFGNYNPHTGEGSLIPRTPFSPFGEDAPQFTIHIPESMNDLEIVQQVREDGIHAVADRHNTDVQDVLFTLRRLRIHFDYEYWAFTCAKIKNKKGKVVPFKFNLSQRKSIAEREKLRQQGKPVWQLELKDRQYGSSTEKNAYIFWLQNVVYDNHNSYIISLDKDVVIDIVDRYERISEHYPPELGRIELKPYKGARSTLKIGGRESFVYLGSVERPNAPSGRTVQHVLISEAGKMKSTDVKSAETLITNIVSLVPEEPYTTLLIESTAEKSGKWFRDECTKALRKESGYHLTFINWLTNEEKVNTRLQNRDEDVDALAFVQSMRPYDWTLWDAGACLEQINWYRIREKRYPNSWQMKQENPTFPEEAFQTTASRYFPVEYVKNIGQMIREPKAIGNIVSDAQTGEQAFTNIRFEEAKEGRVWIWEYPEDIAIEGAVISDQTCGFMDVGGRSAGADKHACTILNRYWMLEMGLPDVVAEYRGNLDIDIAAWEVAKLCHWYNKALLAIEVNTIINRDAREGTYEGEGSLAILNELNGVYDNLYARTLPENTDSGRPLKKLGFHMNASTKVMLYSGLMQAMRDLGYIERSSRAIHEMNVCVLNEKGQIGANEGEHDDLLDTRAGALWLSTHFMHPPSVFYPGKSGLRSTDRQPKGMANI